MTKQEMEKEIKLIRKQLVALCESCQNREDKLFKALEVIAPFLEVLSEKQKEEIENKVLSND